MCRRTSFGLLERLPRPVGITASSSSSSGGSVAVAVSGSVAGLSALSSGKLYYANTKGSLVASAGYAGWSESAASDSYCIFDPASDALVAPGSRVGLATAVDTLFVQTSVQ